MAQATLQDWISSQQSDAAVLKILSVAAESAIEITTALRMAAVSGESAALESVNVQGETQKKLDVVANEIFLRRGAASGVLQVMVSEELDDVSPVADADQEARHALVFDPLDGSSNLDVNGAVGAIFSVLDVGPGSQSRDEVLKAATGTRQVAAGYALFGPATVLVLTTGASVAMFALDEAKGVFVQIDDNVRVPEDTSEFAINASRYHHWYGPTRAYIDNCLAGKDGPYAKRYNMRWCAAMVADLHRILCRGGIFLYPEDEDTKGKGGRLRLLYEANPMAMIVEAAGGRASTGTQRILDVTPSELHQRIGVIIGSAREVEKVEAAYAAQG